MEQSHQQYINTKFSVKNINYTTALKFKHETTQRHEDTKAHKKIKESIEVEITSLGFINGVEK